jgi:glycerophosphoryl diester phosphodiesterase
VANPWLERRVLCYAHQGGAKEAPSSTLFAIDRALASGADAIELDVHRSADGVLVVSHDATLERTTDGVGAIADASADELAARDAAYAFVPGDGAVVGLHDDAYPYRGKGPRDRAFAIATLDEVLERCTGVFLNLDIKQGAPARPAYEEELARTLRRHGRRDDVIVASFVDRRTEAFAAFAPEFATSPGANLLTAFVQAVRVGGRIDEGLLVALSRHVALQVPDAIAGQRLIDERLVTVAHEHALALHVWTVDDPAEMARLVDLGVDGVMTDRPGELVRVLDERGVRYAR